MKINWKVRFRNKVWLLTFITAVLALIYRVCEVLNIAPQIEQEKLMELASMLVGVLVLLGVVTDPTTQGTKDSDLAMSYTKPANKLPELDAQYAEEVLEDEINTGDKMNG